MTILLLYIAVIAALAMIVTAAVVGSLLLVHLLIDMMIDKREHKEK